MLHIRFSNRFEILLDALLAQTRAEAASPFAAVEILVPGAAIRRRIELATADRFGICANVRFSFLAQWLWDQIGKLVAVPAESPFAPALLAWRIDGLLAEPELAAAHPRLAGYLAKADPVMRMELAQRTAALFEQYLTYRPDWMERWLRGEPVAELAAAGDRQAEDQRWQMDLWRRIGAALGLRRHHPALDFLEKIKALDRAALLAAGLPPRVHVFCPPAIPPLYLDLLRRLGQQIEIELYVQNPCEEYWFEIVDRRRLSYLASRQQDLYHEVGNRLLAAWGKQSQAFIDLLLDDAGQATVEHSAFAAPGGATLLQQLQRAVLELRELEPGSVALAADDRSIEIHSCHTLTRELEVLHDQLLAQFATADAPRPSEVLVLTPDLEQAAPLIDAVFGSVPAARRIPYTISGRPGSLVNPVARVLLDLLALAASRFPASAVFGLLQQPAVARRFDLGADELDAVRTWLAEAGIRWGIDAGHRAQYGLPPSERHTFRDGLQRLFLGYALPSALALPFGEHIAAGQVEGGAAAALGSFYRFFTQLEQLQRQLAAPLLPEEWSAALLAMLEDFVAVEPEQIDELRDVQRGIARLAADMRGGGVSRPVPAAVLRPMLQALLDEPTMGGTPSGSVTFAAINSLRALPYRVLCVIGLGDGAFPSPSRPAEFDLMPAAPRRGDRQRGHEQRNLFLDLLLAARERLVLSYTGKSVRDNASLPPSVLVADLLDYLAPAIAADPHSAASLREARARLLLEHPLQPFSLRYFDGAGDPRLASFNREYCAALQQRLAAGGAADADTAAAGAAAKQDDERGGEEDDEQANEAAWQPQPPFFVHPLPAPEAEWRTVTMQQLLQFFRNPCRYLLRQRLGIGMADSLLELADDEPLLAEFAGRQQLAARLLPPLLAGAADDEIRRLARAGLEYPDGPLGELQLDEELQALARFAALLRQRTDSPCLPPLGRELEFNLDGELDSERWRLSIEFGDLCAAGLVRYRYDDARAADYLSAWLQHLFLNAAAEGRTELEAATCWVARDREFRFAPVADAAHQLQQLVRLYRQGLSWPLPFYPKSSFGYVDKDGGMRAASAVWHASMHNAFGENRDQAYQLALRGALDPLGPEFERIAQLVYAPLLQALQEAPA